MRVLVVGGGGREHALAWRLSKTATVFCCPGNPGTAECGENVPDGEIVTIANDLKIDLVVVGPEQQLIDGLADRLGAAVIPVFGPSAADARLEGDKAFAKARMIETGVPTAAYETFTDPTAAKAFASAMFAEGRKVVVKATGQALGKGVVVADAPAEAEEAIEDCLVRRQFGASGDTLVIEERLEGEEVSLFSLRSPSGGIMLPPIRDYKRVGDGNTGPNTGGMGARTLHSVFSDDMLSDWHSVFCDRIADGYTGALFAGLMLTEDGPKCLEYNCRFGDPEAQVLARMLDIDWTALLFALATDSWSAARQCRFPEGASAPPCIAVTLASRGYPGPYQKGLPISGLEHAAMVDGVVVFQAGTRSEGGRLYTNGGRVLTVTATGSTLESARSRAYEAANLIDFEGKQYRSDIGL